MAFKSFTSTLSDIITKRTQQTDGRVFTNEEAQTNDQMMALTAAVVALVEQQRLANVIAFYGDLTQPGVGSNLDESGLAYATELATAIYRDLDTFMDREPRPDPLGLTKPA